MKVIDLPARGSSLDASPSAPVRKWAVVLSHLLDGERIVYVFEKRWLQDARRAHPEKVLYFPPEVDELVRNDADEETVRLIHRVKKAFGGWIVPRHSYRALGIIEGGRHYERNRRS